MRKFEKRSGRDRRKRAEACVRVLEIVALAILLTGSPLASARAATLFGIVEQGGSVVSDGSGIAEIVAGSTATLSIVLGLDPDEDASVFEGVFDLVISGVGVAVDVAAVEAEWASVAENTTGSQSTWSNLSAPLGGDRLVAQWSVDTTGDLPGDSFGVFLGAGTFAGTDLDVEPFFELLELTNGPAELLAQVNVVIPEPGTASLLALGFVALQLTRRRRPPTG